MNKRKFFTNEEKKIKAGRACAPNSANLAGAAQRPDCAPERSTTLNVSTISREEYKAGHNDSGSTTCAPEVCTTSNVSTMPSAKKKSRKMLRFFTAAGLALIMGAGVLCGTLIPMNSACATTSAGASPANASASSEEAAAMAAQEALLNGTLELDPENDPVIFTTDYGLEIKSHDAGELNVSLKEADGSITVSSTEWNYFSAGGYNWIIIGSYSESSYTISAVTGDRYSGLADNTAAGTAVKNDASKQVIKVNKVTVPAFSNAKAGYNGEIPFGCVLCLCAGNITTTTFNASISSGNNYSGSNLQSYMNNTVYGSTSTLSTGLKALKIVPQKLTTLYYNSAKSTINNAYVFPLAGINNTESFYVGSYLDSTTKRDIDASWWLRSGTASDSSYAYSVNTDGGVIYRNYGVTYSNGVRPAFVLQLYSA